MKVILLENVPKLGKKFEVKEVANGYARNFLLPNKLVDMATDEKMASFELQKSLYEEKQKLEHEKLLEGLSKVKDVKINHAGKANEKGSLFVGIKREDIAKMLEDQAKIVLDSKHIMLKEPIKEVGEHEIELVIDDNKTKIKLIVEASTG